MIDKRIRFGLNWKDSILLVSIPFPTQFSWKVSLFQCPKSQMFDREEHIQASAIWQDEIECEWHSHHRKEGSSRFGRIWNRKCTHGNLLPEQSGH